MRESVIHRLLLPAAVGLIAVIFALNVMERLLMQQQAQVEAATKAQAVFVKNKIESVLQARTLPLELLGRRWEIRGEINDIDMESDAALVMSGLPAYQSLEWVDPTFHVRWASRKPPADAPSGASTIVRIVNNTEEPITLSEPESNNHSFAAELKTTQPGKRNS